MEKQQNNKISDSSGMDPIETQRAECTLISGDVRASAEATVSRKLEGFCATGNQLNVNSFVCHEC